MLVPFDRTQQYAGSWTSDGTRVLYTKRTETFGLDIWIVDVATGERRPVLATSFDESGQTVSPNGQWMAYLSKASGRSEAYLRPFPEGTWQTRLSTEGASQLAWRADGRELFYYEPSGSLRLHPVGRGRRRPDGLLPGRRFTVLPSTVHGLRPHRLRSTVSPIHLSRRLADG